jgi:hypothetical protein
MPRIRKKPVPPFPENLREIAMVHSLQIKNSLFVLLNIIDILELDRIDKGNVYRSGLLLNATQTLDVLMYDIEKRLREPDIYFAGSSDSLKQ